MMEGTRCTLIMTLMVAPRAFRIAADQNISPNKAGMYNRPPMRGPYRSWKGSIIVKYSLLRMILAKPSPPRKCSETHLIISWAGENVKRGEIYLPTNSGILRMFFGSQCIFFWGIVSKETEDSSRRNEGPQKDSGVSLLLDWLITDTHPYRF